MPTAPASTSLPDAAAPQDRRVVLWLGVLAAAHVLFYSAAFPCFNIVDEQYHLDMVVKYSHGQLPRGLERFNEESVAYVVFYGTPEYFWKRSAFTNGVPPPAWTVPPEKIAAHLLATEAHWKQLPNVEAAQPPLYYLLAGAWWKLAGACGLTNGPLLYSVRFLNAGFAVLLVWLGFLAARTVVPESRFVQLGVPTLLACLPQPAFYSIGNDMLSALGFGWVFLCVVRLLHSDPLPTSLGAATGLAIAATYLIKLSNLPLLATAVAAILWRSWQWWRGGRLRANVPALLLLVVCAGVPIIGWMLWTKASFGDFTGSADKIKLLDWTVKPWAERWPHPIFTPAGAWTFLSGLLATLWQGEFLWYGERMTFPLANVLYALASLGLGGLAVAKLVRDRARTPTAQLQALWFACACVAAGILFLAYLSISFDFGNCFYPSREHPYFTSGRLLTGALIPFLLLWMLGLEAALRPLKHPAWRWWMLAGWLVAMLTVEVLTNRPVFANPYNWFHL